VIISARTLEERLKRAELESKRLADDMKARRPGGPYKIIVDFVCSCRVTRDRIMDTPAIKSATGPSYQPPRKGSNMRETQG
jgi:hypothetical protein